MADYFNPNDSDDTDLLHPDVQGHSDLSRMAGIVEHEVIEQYAVYTTGGDLDEVLLLGYETDADDPDTGAKLKEALRRTIAEVISYRLRHQDKDPEVASYDQGGRGTEYRNNGSKEYRWPPNWDRRLVPFDERAPAYHV